VIEPDARRSVEV